MSRDSMRQVSFAIATWLSNVGASAFASPFIQFQVSQGVAAKERISSTGQAKESRLNAGFSITDKVSQWHI